MHVEEQGLSWIFRIFFCSTFLSYLTSIHLRAIMEIANKIPAQFLYYNCSACSFYTTRTVFIKLHTACKKFFSKKAETNAGRVVIKWLTRIFVRAVLKATIDHFNEFNWPFGYYCFTLFLPFFSTKSRDIGT